MDIIYSEMIERNKNLIKNKFSFDPLLREEKDTRMCYAAFCYNPSFEFSQEYKDFISSLNVDIGIIYSPQSSEGVLHWSLLQIIKFEDEHLNNLSGEISEKYFSILREIFSSVPPFEINYNRIITTPSGLLMAGECSIDVNFLRDRFRARIREEKLELIEPYYNNIYHSTIYRFTSSPPKDFYVEIKKDGLVKCKIHSLTLGLATWRMLRSEVFNKELKFQSKTLYLEEKSKEEKILK